MKQREDTIALLHQIEKGPYMGSFFISDGVQVSNPLKCNGPAGLCQTPARRRLLPCFIESCCPHLPVELAGLLGQKLRKGFFIAHHRMPDSESGPWEFHPCASAQLFCLRLRDLSMGIIQL